MAKYIVLVLILFQPTAFAEPRVRPSDWAVPIIGSELDNWYQVDKDIYRSEQPDQRAFQEMKRFGVSEVLNLREYHSDNDEAQGLGLMLIREVLRNHGFAYQLSNTENQGACFRIIIPKK